MGRKVFYLFALLLIGTLLAACGVQSPPVSTPEPTAQPPTPDPAAGGTIHGRAQVDDVEILILESFPVQVNAIARGFLPDGCTTIDTITQERTGQEFQVTITTTRPADAMCTQALVPFEERISLEVQGLPAGTYRVDVNGVSRSFELAVDNTSPQEPAPGDNPLLTWHREGGIAGFCDDLTVYASGDAYARSCKGTQSGEWQHIQMTGQQLDEVTAWMDEFQAFEVEQTDPATADAMTIRLRFAGRGTVTPTDAEKQEILNLAATLYAQP